MARSTQTQPRIQVLEDRSVPAMLSGIVFADANGNNVQDAGETGLSGISVQLDAATPGQAPTTVVTDADGRYTFDNAVEGSNKVTAVPTAGITPNNSTTATITIAAGATTATQVPSIGLQPNGRVAGTIFTDLNGDGVKQDTEPGYAGVMINIDINSDGTNNFSTNADATGVFNLGGLPDGVHKVTAVMPLNHKATTATSSSITIVNGNAAPSLTVGFRPTTGVSGRVTLAASADGTTGLVGTTVGLDTNGDGKADLTTTTDGAGNYLFSNVPAGTMTVIVTAPAGSQFTTADGKNKTTVTVTPSILGTNNIVAASTIGVLFPGSVTGALYLDANNNGVKDSTEAAVVPGSVEVDLNGTGTLVTVRTVALADGSFRVDGLPDGNHFLIVNPSGGLTTTALTRIPFSVTGGSSTTTVAIGLRGGGIGSTLTIGSGSGTSAESYTFTQGPNGTLIPTRVQRITTPATGSGGTRSITADFNGDGTDDVIVATGPGEAPIIRVYDGKTGQELVAGGIAAFENAFVGGVNLAAGDFNKDGKADIVAAADTGGGPRVRIFNSAQYQAGADPAQGKLFTDFFAIEDTKFRGGVRATVGDLNGDGTPDLAVAAGVGGGPRIAVFDGASLLPGNAPKKLIGDFFAFEPQLRNGAMLSIGDVNGDGVADLVAGAGSGGAPRVVVFSGIDLLANRGSASTRIADFYVNGDVTSRSGTNVTVKDLDKDGKGDVVATNGETAYVFTSEGITDNFLNPSPTGPSAAAALDPFDSVKGVNIG